MLMVVQLTTNTPDCLFSVNLKADVYAPAF